MHLRPNFVPVLDGWVGSQLPFAFSTRGANLRPGRGNLCTPPLPLEAYAPRNCLRGDCPVARRVPDTKVRILALQDVSALMARTPPEAAVLRLPPKRLPERPKANPREHGSFHLGLSVQVHSPASSKQNILVFSRASLRDSPRSLRLSSGRTYPTRNFAYLRTVIVTAAVSRLRSRLPFIRSTNCPLTCPATGQASSPHTWSLHFCGDRVFW
ncbi:uncharacterized protein LOC119369472 [Jatropha curcas]|uniref:uncharacterized protein LOC119369472 n=1 Tax=Jatropha curcas TaxID=180498 RepID=UPI0018961707|nr:uncharacterized protein LOC119369472 [Jatropha curcas]